MHKQLLACAMNATDELATSLQRECSKSIVTDACQGGAAVSEHMFAGNAGTHWLMDAHHAIVALAACICMQLSATCVLRGPRTT